LASSLQEEARKTAKSEGVSLNQLINLAVAEKVSVLRTEEFFVSEENVPAQTKLAKFWSAQAMDRREKATKFSKELAKVLERLHPDSAKHLPSGG
jgi:hypothetical protein